MFGTSIPSRRDLEEWKRELSAEKAVSDAMIDLMLLADAPERVKVELQLIKQYGNISDAAETIVEIFTIKAPSDKRSELLEAQKAACDYLEIVADGLKQYLEEAIKITQSN